MALYAKMKGPVDYTVVGSPTITDGVVSSFSNTNYIQTSENFSFANPLEIYFTAITSSNVNTSQLFCSVGNGGTNRSFGVTIETGGKMGVAYTINGSSWVGWLPSSYIFEGNTRYNFLIQYIPSQVFTINVKKSTETSWTTFTNSISSPIYTSANCPFIFGQNYQNKPFYGSIDLNETYIKVNGQLWFGNGFDRVKIRTAPYERYTVTGTPTIIDNVMSNFSNSNYATTTSAFEVANYDNVEIYVRAKTPVNTSAGWTDIIENGGVGSYRNLGAYANGALTAYYFNFFGHDFWRYNISADTWYRLKLTTTASTQSGYIYDDNGNLLYQSNDARRIAGTSVLSFGGRYSANKIGAIDFNNTYIKVNGQYWWRGDMQYVQTYTLHQGE